MNTHAPQRMLDADALDDQPRGFVSAAVARCQQALCALRGHDSILQYERSRIFLRCTSCGHETPGWEVSSAEASVYRVGPRRAAAAAPHGLAVARKIA